MKQLVIDLPLSAIFLVASFFALRPTVPSTSEFWVNFWGFAGALCMTGVFWLALQMFRVVLADQLKMKKERSHEN